MRKYPTVDMLELMLMLYQERNLSAAAEKCGIPMSTASRYLSELRVYFDDLLFARSRDGLLPTDTAIKLTEKVRQIVDVFHALDESERFDPWKCSREIRIGCVDNAVYSLVPNLISSVRTQAPGISLTFLPLYSNRYEMLRTKVLDFLISPRLSSNSDLHSLELGFNEYVLLGASDHPLYTKCLSEKRAAADEEIRQFAFIDILVGGASNMVLLRNVRFPTWQSAPSAAKSFFFLPFARTVASSDLLMVLPRRSAEEMTRTHQNLAVIPTVTRSITDRPHLIWHPITHNDPLMQWMRGMILSAAKNTV